MSDERTEDGGPAQDATLRDLFAGQAMAALMSYEHVMALDAAGVVEINNLHARVSWAAYDLADAMLRARKGVSQ